MEQIVMKTADDWMYEYRNEGAYEQIIEWMNQWWNLYFL